MPTVYTFAPANSIGASEDQPAVYSTAPTLDTGFGTDRTPSGWPMSGKIAAVEAELTVTTAFTADAQIQFGVADPAGLSPLPAATSDASGVFTGWTGLVRQYRTSSIDALHLDKFGAWRTDYLTFTSHGATPARLVSTSSITPGTGIDIRARVRSADWDHASSRRICTTGTSLGVIHTSLRLASAGVTATVLDAAGTATITATAPWSAFSETDGQWLGIRFTLTGSTGTWYEDTSASPLLNSWTPVHTATFTSANTTPATTINVGATNANTSGLDGDLSHWEIRDGSGAIIHRLALDAMDAAADTGWSSPYNSISRDASGNTANGSTIAATKRVRIDLDAPCPWDAFRLILDAQTGVATVEEIVLEMAKAGGIYVDGAVHF